MKNSKTNLLPNIKTMKKYLFIIVIIIFIPFACTQLSPEEQEIFDNLNKTVNLDMFESDPVYQKDTIICIDALLRKYKFISIVYLQDGCAPCYPIYIDWHKKMDSLGVRDDYTVLFIIEGNIYSSYERLIKNVKEVGEIEDKYYTIIDTNFKFLDGNKDMPCNIIKRSLLLNEDNKIKLIGYPFSSSGMSELFLSIINK